MEADDFANADNSYAVSYTHLDVYKRQALPLLKTDGGQTPPSNNSKTKETMNADFKAIALKPVSYTHLQMHLALRKAAAVLRSHGFGEHSL